VKDLKIKDKWQAKKHKREDAIFLSKRKRFCF